MERNNFIFDLRLPFFVWFTSIRTEGIFYEEVKKHSKFRVYNVKDFKRNKIFKLIIFVRMLSNDNCKGILVDSSNGIASLMLISLSRLFKFPIFMRLNGGMNNEFIDKIDIENYHIRYIRAVFKTFFHRRMLCAAKKIFPVSVFSKSQVLYELPDINIHRIKVIYQPIDFNAINNTEKNKFRKWLNISNDKKILLTSTGFMYKRKFEALLYYHEVIIDLLKENLNLIYIILGDGPGLKYFKEEVKRITPESEQNRIICAGFYPKIYEALLDVDLFVYMSHRDAGPGVLKEAQAVGIPVLSNYSCFGTNEFLPPDYNGRIKSMFEEKQELHDLLISIMKDENLRKTMGDINRKIAEEKYNPSKVAEIFLNELGLLSPIK
jgi:glycosyltransferase involved in cell wall biosynthesis